MTTARQMAGTFVGHATLLLAVNLAHDLDPVLAGLMPTDVPTAEELLIDQMLIDQVIRAPRGDVRLERTLSWLEQVWFNLEDRQHLRAPILADLAARRDNPVIFDLESDLIKAADLLDQLLRQSQGMRDTAGLAAILSALRQWRAAPSRDALVALERACAAALTTEEDDLPSTALVRRVRFYAEEGSISAGEYLTLHFDPKALIAWDLDELTKLVRMRYPLMRRVDVTELLAPVRSAVA